MDDSARQADDSLEAALARHGFEFSSEQVEALSRYAAALWEWNGRLNLTRHTTFERFVGRDVLDSAQLAQLLNPSEKILDVGTGGGVPGVIIAILRPDLKVTLSESIAKKATAVEAIVRQSEIKVGVKHARAEDVVQSERLDTLVIRAVAPLPKLLTWFKPHWKNIGRMLIIKGPSWIEERGKARHHGLMSGLQMRRVATYPLPDSGAESVILEIRAKSDA
jgi:16S rRNA (guanine527-N7)-methyltransferase